MKKSITSNRILSQTFKNISASLVMFKEYESKLAKAITEDEKDLCISKMEYARARRDQSIFDCMNYLGLTEKEFLNEMDKQYDLQMGESK